MLDEVGYGILGVLNQLDLILIQRLSHRSSQPLFQREILETSSMPDDYVSRVRTGSDIPEMGPGLHDCRRAAGAGKGYESQLKRLHDDYIGFTRNVAAFCYPETCMLEGSNRPFPHEIGQISGSDKFRRF